MANSVIAPLAADTVRSDGRPQTELTRFCTVDLPSPDSPTRLMTPPVWFVKVMSGAAKATPNANWCRTNSGKLYKSTALRHVSKSPTEVIASAILLSVSMRQGFTPSGVYSLDPSTNRVPDSRQPIRANRSSRWASLASCCEYAIIYFLKLSMCSMLG